MGPPDPDAAFAVLRAADPEVMDRDALAELACVLKSHRAWLDSLQVRITRRQRGLAEEGRAEAPKDLLARAAQARGELQHGGALADPCDLALLVFAGDGPEHAENFARHDPYVLNGLVTAWRVRQWNEVLADGSTRS
jgi:uncharacterized protein YciI